MIRIGKSKWILIAAISSLSIFSVTPAIAQFRVGQDGGARDASNRVGSGGYNSPALPPSAFLNNGNQIVTGNVTGGKEFRGQIQYTDPLEFRGNIASQQIDRFIAGSAGAPLWNQPAQLPGTMQPFYGRALAAPPPTGFVQTPGTGTYNYAPAPAASPFDLRVDVRMLAPRPTDMLIPGPVDSQTKIPTMLSASPLLGVRQLKLGEAPDMQFINNYSGLRQDTALDRLQLDPQMLQQLQDELEKAAGKTPGGKITSAVPKPFDAPETGSLSPKPLDSSIKDQRLSNEVRAEGSEGRRFAVPPQDQSSQYGELQRRLNRYYTDRLETDEDRNREFLKQLRAKEAADKAPAGRPNPLVPGKGPGIAPEPLPQGAQPPATPDYGKIARELIESPVKKPQPDNPKDIVKSLMRPKPVKIASLATGVEAQGFANILKKAESLMKEGKFSSALDQYEAADRVAPNNPLVWLGQANAQLGAAYYAKAEQSLRRAFSADPVLTMAQFDLRAMMGEECIMAIVKDLRASALQHEKDAGLPLLLAYIAYNTGNETEAAVFLDRAQQRAGGKDEFFKLLWTHWALPDVPAAPR
jgi:tetratricopeptide (TPR) repeat protein